MIVINIIMSVPYSPTLVINTVLVCDDNVMLLYINLVLNSCQYEMYKLTDQTINMLDMTMILKKYGTL